MKCDSYLIKSRIIMLIIIVFNNYYIKTISVYTIFCNDEY